MGNMNLLNSVFDIDDIEITEKSTKYSILIIVIIISVMLMLFVPKNNYYSNSFISSNDGIELFVEKEYSDRVVNSKEIIINKMKYDYSIKEVIPFDDNFLIRIIVDNKIESLNRGTYQINLGKERLFDYIIRIIKK